MGRTYREEKVWGRKKSTKPKKRISEEDTFSRRLDFIPDDEGYDYEEEYTPKHRSKNKDNF